MCTWKKMTESERGTEKKKVQPILCFIHITNHFHAKNKKWEDSRVPYSTQSSHSHPKIFAHLALNTKRMRVAAWWVSQRRSIIVRLISGICVVNREISRSLYAIFLCDRNQTMANQNQIDQWRHFDLNTWWKLDWENWKNTTYCCRNNNKNPNRQLFIPILNS